MTLWIDADSCPVGARCIIQRFSLRRKIPSFYVANHPIPIPRNPLFTMVVTGTAEGAADDYIVLYAIDADIVITRDIPLASRLVERGVTVLNDRGDLFTSENARERLSLRNFHAAIREMGLEAPKYKPYNDADLQRFANCLDRTITKKLSATLSVNGEKSN
jgi:uncharacterized protein YaiI (UPF0178 family)